MEEILMIRFAKAEDIPNIMNFIDKYWCKNHIMSYNRDLFEFQHKWEEEISFVISEIDGNINGLLGYIPYDNKNRDITLAIWKTRKTKETMQGINILIFLRNNGDVKSIAAPGINPETIPIYKFLGLKTGKMKHWFRLRNVPKYKIAKVVNIDIPEYRNKNDIILYKIDHFHQVREFKIDQCLIREKQLYKSKSFIERRYFNHPFFEYIKYGLTYENKKLFVVLRLQEYNGAKVLRLIDSIGDQELLKYFTYELDNLMQKYECEYIDCYETGIKDEIFEDGGWKLVSNSENIIPDYFSPFEQRNIDIYYMSEIENVILFKGDGDMDRPN